MISADEIYDSALHTFANEANAVAKLADTVDRESYVKAVRMIAECEGRIITTGCGTSGACAKKVSQVFNCVDRASQFLNPADAPHGDYGMIRGEILLSLYPRAARPNGDDKSDSGGKGKRRQDYHCNRESRFSDCTGE